MAKLKFNFQSIVTAVVVGAADEALERMDAKVPERTAAMKGYKDYFRIGATVLGLGAGIIMPKYHAIGDALATASIPLLVKSLSKVVMAEGTASRAYGRAQSRSVTGALGRSVSSRSPEFDAVRML
jgi:hypothetical protein